MPHRSQSFVCLLVAAFGCARAMPGDGMTCHPAEGDPETQICVASGGPVQGHAQPVEDLNPRLLRRFQPLRSDFSKGEPGSPSLVALGRMLYYEPRLSKTGLVSCNSCHPLDRYGTTGDERATGVSGKRGLRNTPTTYNAAAQFSQFWDGRSPDVETQALSPLLDPQEMGMTAETTVAALTAARVYGEPFRAAFPGEASPLTFHNVGLALGAFERTLSTPSRWDQYLSGDRAALTPKEKEGLRVFTSVGCMVCHTGELVGGSLYEKLGVVTRWPSGEDHGRASVTHNPNDEMMFKVPGLRNVARTAPYFHDGSVKTLDQAVRMMGAYQLGLDLSDAEVASLVAFLGSLTGKIPQTLLTARPR